MGNRLRRVIAAPHRAELVRGLRDSVRPAGGEPDLAAALEGAYGWLRAAHDAHDDGGVAGWYDLLAGAWSGSYPETTGYIIPTFLAYAEATGDADARARALRMADWECAVQLASGAVVSGFVGASDEPAVFNTGQCLFGWATAFDAVGDPAYRTAAERAAAWLMDHQEADGSWRRQLSALARGEVHTYNTRSAWGLAVAGSVLGEPSFVEAALRNCRWALTQRDERGWFASTGFTAGEAPLLHTTAYVLEGLQGVHALTGEAALLDAVQVAADALVAAYRRDGGLAGRYGPAFTPAARWRCLTGEAQLAVVLLRLARTVPGRGAGAAGRRRLPARGPRAPAGPRALRRGGGGGGRGRAGRARRAVVPQRWRRRRPGPRRHRRLAAAVGRVLLLLRPQLGHQVLPGRAADRGARPGRAELPAGIAGAPRDGSECAGWLSPGRAPGR